ncbi:MAG: hypothetical protein GPJ52_02815 [Candidatus Heimdallarchaeota archaeon]|nr:hypothetical protein [Candidatus Heimdallarchaeota archaeon]
MVEYIEIWSIIIGSVLGTVGTGLGIWNLIKSLVKKPKPTILEPVIGVLRHPMLPEYPIRIDFEIRNNGDRATRLYLYSTLSLYQDENLVLRDIQELDYNGNVVYEEHMLPPHCIVPTHFSHMIYDDRIQYNNGIVILEGHFFNHKNKKIMFRQKFSFKDVNNEWIVEEIKERKRKKVN